MPKVTVLVPTHDHCVTLKASLGSALVQTMQDLEILVVGDGAPDETAAVIKRIGDRRIKYFPHAKGPRTGEIYRHALLTSEAQGEFVCYLSDDDLWLPNHLETMCALLSQADFAATMTVFVNLDFAPFVIPNYLQDSVNREFILKISNRIALTTAGHTLSFYKQLPYGWRTTPAGRWTDHYMWQQFLSLPECRALSAPVVTSLKFPDPPRKQMSNNERLEEMEHWRKRIAEPDFDAIFAKEVLEGTIMHAAHNHSRAKLSELELSEKVEEQAAVIKMLEGQLEQLRNLDLLSQGKS